MIRWFNNSQLLLKAVKALGSKIDTKKWQTVAKEVPSRSSKQCRERYINHLDPTLKFDWGAHDEALLFFLFSRYSTKWSVIATMFPRRTDHICKNRIHFLRRKIDKDFKFKFRKFSSPDMANDSDSELSALSHENNLKNEMLHKVHKMLKILAAESMSRSFHPKKAFGKLIEVTGNPKMCKRCQFFVPSAQTGKFISASGWCEACTKIPSYVAGDMLRRCLNLRYKTYGMRK